jgi:hypothetical protein
MCVVAYVSGHGFGHAAREVEVLRRLPSDIPLIVKTVSAEWFWRAEMRRPFTYVGESFDVGCVQHDSLTLDIPATLAAYREREAANAARFDAEVQFLRVSGARVVLTDVPSFPLTVAARAEIPGICLSNFTWADIYDALTGVEPAFGPIAERLRGEYQTATLCLDADLSLPMPYFLRREPTGLISRSGTARREDLMALLPAAARGKRIALLYLGNWGYPLAYERLTELRDCHFLSFEEPPVPVANWTALARSADWPHPDLVASVDFVVSKPGYGLTAECLATGTPLVYMPRPEFAEYPALRRALQAWSGGVEMPRADFLALRWNLTLARVPSRSAVARLPAEGGGVAAARILDFYR